MELRLNSPWQRSQGLLVMADLPVSNKLPSSKQPLLSERNRWRVPILDPVLILNILVFRFTEQLLPLRAVEVGKLLRSAGHRGKPVIKHHMVWGGDGPGARVEHSRSGGQMFVGNTNKDNTFAFGLPSWQLLSISNALVQKVGRRSPDMNVMEAALGLASGCEDIHGRQSSRRVGHAVVDVHGIVNGQGPKRGVGHFGPVGGSMQHHGASNGHDGADGALSDGIVVMGPSAGKANDLLKLGQMGLEFLGCEGCPTV